MADRPTAKRRADDSPRAATSREQTSGTTQSQATRSGEALRLSDPAARQDVANLQREITKDPQRAAELLRRAGIINSNGRLTRDFGG